MTEFDVVGFGALNVDKLFRVNKIAGRDEESFVIEQRESSGGSAANTIIGLARLGLRTGFIGKVAQDLEGQQLLADFRKENVDTKGIKETRKGRSGIVMGFVDKEGERALYVDPGVNNTIDLNDVDAKYAEKTRILHVTSFVGQKSFEGQKKLVEKLPAHVRLSFDPGMIYAKRGLTELKPILQRTFVVLPNETELKLLTGEDYRNGARKLMAEGVRVVAVKMGRKGCFITSGEESYAIESFKVKVLDATGAGDAWNAGFLYGLLKGKSLQDCGRYGNFVASKCIIKMGARTGLPQHIEPSWL